LENGPGPKDTAVEVAVTVTKIAGGRLIADAMDLEKAW
jgi:hypothetical protein